MTLNLEPSEVSEMAPGNVNKGEVDQEFKGEVRSASVANDERILREVLDLSDWSAIRKKIRESNIKTYLPLEQRRLWQERIQAGDKTAFRVAVVERLPYIAACVDTFQRFIPKGSEKEVLADAIAAVADYYHHAPQPKAGTDESYLARMYDTIKQAIMRAVGRFCSVSVGSNMALLNRTFDLLFYKESFYAEYGGEPSEEAVKNFLTASGIGSEAMQDTLALVKAFKIGADSHERRVDEEKIESPENLGVLLGRDLLGPELEMGMRSALREREAEILRLRYGLSPANKPHTLREVSEIFKISRERVGNIEIKAIDKLKTFFRNRPAVRDILRQER